MISVSACWFNFRTWKRRCKSCRMLNVQSEVYKWRVLEKLGCWCVEILGRPFLSRRDVEFSRRDVIFEALCHVVTWNSHVATSFLKPSVTSRRGILTSRRGILTSRRHFYTSRHHLVTYSATSRRGPARRDVIWSCSLPRCDVGF